jgi:predicted Zn-dependent protease
VQRERNPQNIARSSLSAAPAARSPGTIARHGQSAQAFADLMRRLRLQLHAKEESDSVLQYLSTHPATEERIQRAQQQRQSMPCRTPMS